MSTPVAASIYESLAGAYWSVAHHERAIAERCRKAGANLLALDHQGSAARAEILARDAEDSARQLWANPSEAT